MAKVNPYLNFSGNCEEAFEFYRSVFGGEFSTLSRFSEMPAGAPSPEPDGNKIMHVSLPLGEGQVLMGSDRPGSMGPAVNGNAMSVSVSPTSSEEAATIFKGLSEGGEITMPLDKMFWGAEYGACSDRFGVQWMVNYDPNEPN
ncbi:MAG: VOC family protein [Actinomycetota bacterium]